MKLNKKVLAFLSSFAVIALFSTSAFAQTGAEAAAGNAYSMISWLGIAAGFGIAIAAFGGALGMGYAVASTMEGIARNPGSRDEVFVPFIIGLALIESLVIYAFVIAFFLQQGISIEDTISIAV